MIDMKEVLRLAYEGKTRDEIAKLLRRTRSGISQAISRMRKNGVEVPRGVQRVDYDELKAYSAQLASQKKRNSIENERAK